MTTSAGIFAVLYLGGVFAVLAVLGVGILFWLRRSRPFDEELELQAVLGTEPEIRLKNLENRIENLIRANTQVNERVGWLERRLSAPIAQGGPGGKATLAEQVCQAFDRGRPVAELADEFGRHKGEIELMLNLRRMRRESESG